MIAERTVPAVWCPLPSAIHPSWQRIHEDAVDWMMRMRLYRSPAQLSRNASSGAGELASRVAADADEEPIRLYAHFLIWLFSFDDEWCSEGRYGASPEELAVLAARLLRVAETPGPERMFGDEPWTTALRDIRSRLACVASDTQIARWAHAMRMYLFGQVWEAGLRAKGLVPDLNDYMAMRIHSGGLGPCAALLDVLHGQEATPAELHRPEVKALTEMMSIMVGVDNDIISQHKESRRSTQPLRLLNVLTHHHQLTQDEAVEEVIALRDQVLTRYLVLRRDTDQDAAPGLAAYLTGLDRWIRANLDWSYTCARYIHPEDPVTMPCATLAAPRPGPARERLCVPSISWWWT
ncbi:hypothetical protein [Streptomyces sp. NPDC005209]|uniref:terpene synthase family protein n=1 Tax=Streptomyces sp. NPDC005209 TaxID=3156715 RepID=UPI0033BE18FA